MLSAALYLRFGAWANSSATSSVLSTTGRRSGVGMRAMRSPKPARPSVMWKKKRKAVQARFMRHSWH